MEYVAIVSMLVVVEYFVFMGLTGYARQKGGVQAPATTGDPVFERYFRVQQNTVEQLVIFLPSLWVFAYYVHALTAAGLGLVFAVGRLVYLRAYVADPTKRGIGFSIGFLTNIVLVLGGLGGALAALR